VRLISIEISKKTEIMVNSYATNKRQPSIELLYDIAKLLQVDAKELLN
jgi:repressor LexA